MIDLLSFIGIFTPGMNLLCFSLLSSTIKSISSEMLKKFKYDKKNKNNQLTFILNEKIGKSFIKNNMDENILIEFLNDEI